MLLVSVVINTYNRCTTLRDTLSSLQQLNYPRFEVIVVNGPSTDGTDDYLAEFDDILRVGRLIVRANIELPVVDANADVFAAKKSGSIADHNGAVWPD